jgi:hypothetical protein
MTTHDGGEILHNPIVYLVSGTNQIFLFNQPLFLEFLVADVTNSLKRFK